MEIPLDHLEPMEACKGQQLIVITALSNIAPQALVMLHSPQKILKSFTTHRLDQPNSARCSTYVATAMISTSVSLSA